MTDETKPTATVPDDPQPVEIVRGPVTVRMEDGTQVFARPGEIRTIRPPAQKKRGRERKGREKLAMLKARRAEQSRRDREAVS